MLMSDQFLYFIEKVRFNHRIQQTDSSSNLTSLIVVLHSPQRSSSIRYLKYRFGWDKGFKRHFCCGQLSIPKHGSELQADVRRLFPNQHRGTTYTSTRGKCAIHSLHLAASNERNADLPGK